jgi:hypothetical protein
MPVIDVDDISNSPVNGEKVIGSMVDDDTYLIERSTLVREPEEPFDGPLTYEEGLVLHEQIEDLALEEGPFNVLEGESLWQVREGQSILRNGRDYPVQRLRRPDGWDNSEETLPDRVKIEPFGQWNYDSSIEEG